MRTPSPRIALRAEPADLDAARNPVDAFEHASRRPDNRRATLRIHHREVPLDPGAWTSATREPTNPTGQGPNEADGKLGRFPTKRASSAAQEKRSQWALP